MSETKFSDQAGIYFICSTLLSGFIIVYFVPNIYLVVNCLFIMNNIISECLKGILIMFPVKFIFLIEFIILFSSILFYYFLVKNDINSEDNKLIRTRYGIAIISLISLVLVLIIIDRELYTYLILFSYILLIFSSILFTLLLLILFMKYKYEMQISKIDLLVISLSIPTYIVVTFFIYLKGIGSAFGS